VDVSKRLPVKCLSNELHLLKNGGKEVFIFNEEKLTFLTGNQGSFKK
jgi:hypothetical protein